MRTSFDFKLQGFPQANRDATVELVNEGTGQKLALKPYLDGTLSVRDLDPGLYQVTVKHPNVVSPVYQERVRLFDQPSATMVPIAVDPGLFRTPGPLPGPGPLSDSVADLTPVQQAATAAKERLRPVAGKASGEVIRASDWNALVSSVSDLAGALHQLCTMVAPLGHDHPQLTEKLNSMQSTLNNFTQSFGKAQLQMQRQMQVSLLRQYADLMFALPNLNASGAETAPLLSKLDDLSANLDADSTTFTLKLVAACHQALTTINNLFVSPARAGLANNDVVKQLRALAQQHAKMGVQFEPIKEIASYAAANSLVRSNTNFLLRG
jgi:hypothetical protein